MSHPVPCLLALTTILLMSGGALRAAPPSALGFRVVWVHQKVNSKLDPNHPLCSGRFEPGQRADAERYLAQILDGVRRGRQEQASCKQKDLEHPDVAAAIAHMNALEACSKRIQAGLAGPPPAAPVAGVADGAEDGGSPEPAPGSGAFITDPAPTSADALVAAVPPADREVLNQLAAWSPTTPDMLPPSVAALASMAGAAERIWPRCTGEYAAVIMAGPPPEGAPAAGDPWAWCRAAAQRVTHGRQMVEQMIGRSVATLDAARATLEAAGSEALTRLQTAASEAEATAARARAAAEAGVAEAKRVGAEVATRAEDAVVAAAFAVKDQLAELEALYEVVGRAPEATAAAGIEAARAVYGKVAVYVDRATAAAQKVVTALADKATREVARLGGKAADAARDGARKLLKDLLGGNKRK